MDLSRRRVLSVLKGFSLVELLVVIAMLAVMLALLTPAIAKARQASKRVACLAQGREVYLAVAGYTNDFRSYFPSFVPDVNVPPIRDSLYTLQVWRLLASDDWVRYSGLGRHSRFAQCPATPQARIEIDENWFRTMFIVSASTLISPAYLGPDVQPMDWQGAAGARVQRLDSVSFPSDKVAVYEAEVWHGWFRGLTPGSDLSGLYYDKSSAPGTVAYMDGHAALRFPAGARYMDRYPMWDSMPYGTTVNGVFGRD